MLCMVCCFMVGTANEDDENTLENVSLEEEVGGIGFKQHKKLFTNELFAKGLRVDKLNLVKPF